MPIPQDRTIEDTDISPFLAQNPSSEINHYFGLLKFDLPTIQKIISMLHEMVIGKLSQILT
jgi:hypothetical protein